MSCAVDGAHAQTGRMRGTSHAIAAHVSAYSRGSSPCWMSCAVDGARARDIAQLRSHSDSSGVPLRQCGMLHHARDHCKLRAGGAARASAADRGHCCLHIRGAASPTPLACAPSQRCGGRRCAMNPEACTRATIARAAHFRCAVPVRWRGQRRARGLERHTVETERCYVTLRARTIAAHWDAWGALCCVRAEVCFSTPVIT